MAGETPITVIGNLTADPELRFTPNGAAVANFTVASTPRTFNKQTNQWEDGEAMFLRCSIWREAAENVAGSLTKGARVIVQGNLKARSFEDKDGNKRTSWEVDALEVGPSLKFATAQVSRSTPGQQGGGFGAPAPQSSGWGQSQPQAPAPAQAPPQGQPQQQVPQPQTPQQPDPWSGTSQNTGWGQPQQGQPPF